MRLILTLKRLCHVFCPRESSSLLLHQWSCFPLSHCTGFTLFLFNICFKGKLPFSYCRDAKYPVSLLRKNNSSFVTQNSPFSDFSFLCPTSQLSSVTYSLLMSVCDCLLLCHKNFIVNVVPFLIKQLYMLAYCTATVAKCTVSWSR